eukprot:5549512-Heterocapsa_arctica.AAC.1
MSHGSSASQSHNVPLTLRWTHSSWRQAMVWPKSRPAALAVRPNMMVSRSTMDGTWKPLPMA